MAQAIERGRLKEPPAQEVMDYMIKPTLTDEEVERSYQSYIDINKAHVLMLARQGIIGAPAAAKILEVARKMAAMGDKPDFEITPALEEMYFNLENYLIGQVGMEVGGQQHTARSRNDLHATVDRMVTRKAFLDLCTLINKFRRTLIALARKNEDAVMSGYTHLQPSEPMTFGHYLSAVSLALARDYSRLSRAWDSINLNPLGGGSMGSTTWNIDRRYTTELLGFDDIVQNSIDCVCSRDYLMEVMGALSIMANTIARMTTDMRIWSTPDFGYVEVSDSCAVCSSIMPQKKNPWTFETTAGLCARVKSDFDAVWMTYKGVPYAFTMESMDVIADFWPCVKDMTAILKLMDVTMAGVIVHRDRARSTAAANFCTVTELANTLVRVEGIPFREAHEIVAHMVGYMTEHSLKATEINSGILNEISRKLFNRSLKITDAQIQSGLDPVKNAMSKKVLGGTAPEEVERQLAFVEKRIAIDEAEATLRRGRLAQAHAKLDRAVNSFLAKNS
ncbi:argininosuccinate lyase [Mesosutterella sp. AGMB02718]|uniref:Argininosuccinate lyase n=1 Tax=Mesosutterella faecium TaxID=2925194 RepID=A0ABT7IQ80_9BURK|nr:argininosuccinate lyase [Mesosutterella sp. AGMB02718]MDL2060534.1 argininosuccinate lyase [Mesosutterella sp. AGMB02718]